MLGTKQKPNINQNFSTSKKAKSSSRPLKSKESLINSQKRDKLKQLLVQKYKKIFGKLAKEEIISSEVSSFLKRDKVNEQDLKLLEKKIQKRLTQEKEQETLKANLTNQPKVQAKEISKQEESKVNEPVVLPDINNANADNRSVHSAMSGASDLSKFNERGPGNKVMEEEIRDFKKFNSMKKDTKPKGPQIDYSKYNDEWDAINMYNKKLFEQEKIISRIKDKEVQKRTRNDLDNQVKQKLKKMYEEKLKEQEYDAIMNKHLQKLNELEEKKKLEIKKRIQKEKESRDKQLKDEYIRKRIEVLKNKKYERELVKTLKEEIEREKQLAIEKKLAEKAALQKTLKDNEIHKQKLAEEARKEREDDIKIMEDDAKVKEKQENERIEYFKKIERNANSFMDKMIQTVLKEQEDKNKEEEEKIRQYNLFRDQQADLEEQRRKQKIIENKKMIKNFLDKQCEEKRKEKEYEHQIDLCQGRIWEQDTKNYYEHEKEVAAIIRAMNKNNLEALKYQINYNNNQNHEGMSENEKAMNRELLEKAAAI